MSKPQYRHAHQKQRARWVPVVATGEALCMQTDPNRPGSPPGSGCVMKTRWIAPGAPWQLAHDDSGQIVLGPAHRRCNARDGAIRGNRARAARRRQAVAKPPPASTSGRWVL